MDDEQNVPDVTTMTEEQMRDAKNFWPQTDDLLIKYINNLIKRDHDYGTVCYAMSMAATAAFNFVAHKLGATGFQASCADLDFLKRSRGMEDGFRIVDFSKLLYPQYCNAEHFPTLEDLQRSHRKELREKAKKLLAEKGGEQLHPDIRAHWTELARDDEPITTNEHKL